MWRIATTPVGLARLPDRRELYFICILTLFRHVKCDILNTDIVEEEGEGMATSIRLNDEIEQRLDKLSAETGRTKAFYLRELIERGLEDLEDYYLGMEVLERLRKGEEHTVSLDEAEKELGLDD